MSARDVIRHAKEKRRRNRGRTIHQHTVDITVSVEGLLAGGGPIRIVNPGGALPAGLSADTDYHVVNTDGHRLTLGLRR